MKKNPYPHWQGVDIFVYNAKEKCRKMQERDYEVEESIRRIRKKLEDSIKMHGINSSETIKWSELMNKLINIDYKIKNIESINKAGNNFRKVNKNGKK